LLLWLFDEKIAKWYRGVFIVLVFFVELVVVLVLIVLALICVLAVG